jgi:hypothetical protein
MHAPTHNNFNLQRHLVSHDAPDLPSRSEPANRWQTAIAAASPPILLYAVSPKVT